jgi:hypothetical protein
MLVSLALGLSAISATAQSYDASKVYSFQNVGNSKRAAAFPKTGLMAATEKSTALSLANLFVLTPVVEGETTYYTVQPYGDRTKYVYYINTSDANANIGLTSDASKANTKWLISGNNIKPGNGKGSSWNVRGTNSDWSLSALGQWVGHDSENDNKWTISEVGSDDVTAAISAYKSQYISALATVDVTSEANEKVGFPLYSVVSAAAAANVATDVSEIYQGAIPTSAITLKTPTSTTGLFKIKNVGTSKYLFQEENTKNVTFMNDGGDNAKYYWKVSFDGNNATITGAMGKAPAKGAQNKVYNDVVADYLTTISLRGASTSSGKYTENNFLWPNVHSTNQTYYTKNNAAYNSANNPLFLTTFSAENVANQYTFEVVALTGEEKLYNVSFEGVPNGTTASVTINDESYAGCPTVYNGGFFVLSDASTKTFTASSIRATNSTVAVDGQTIKVVYTTDYNVLLADEVIVAKALLAKTGIGTPGSEARTNLQAAITTAEGKTTGATEADLNTLKAAEATYSATELQLPEDGKAYKPYVLLSNGNKVYANTNGNQVFVVQKVNDTYRLVSSLGNGNVVSENNKTEFTIGTTNRLEFGALTLTYNSNVAVCINAAGTDYNHFSGKGHKGTDWSTEWYFEPAEFAGHVVTFTASNDGQNYATVKLPYAATLPTGVTAYKGNVSGNEVTLTAYKQAGEVLPANTPVLLTANDATSYNFAPAAYQAAEETGFQGTLAAAAVTDNAYILAKKGEEVKFYLLNSESNTVNANKAYIVVSGGKAQALSFNFGTTTGIHAATADAATDAPVFDLSGRRVVKVVKGGLYIQNGKKFIVK